MAIAIARRSGASLAKYCATLMVGRLIISLAGLRVFRADMWRPQRAPLQTGLAPGCGPWTRYAGWWEPRHELEPLRPRDAPSGDFAVPNRHMLLLDLAAEIEPVWRRTAAFYGKPWVWNMLHNFGGNISMFGRIDGVASAPA